MRLAQILMPAMLLTLAACAGDDDTDMDTDVDTDTDTQADETGRVRITHLAVFPTGQSDVDVWIDGEKSDVTVAYGDSTRYVDLAAGTYDLSIVPSGMGMDDALETVTGFEVEADKSYSLVAQGAVQPSEFEKELVVIGFDEEYDGLAAGDTRLNIVHSASATIFDPVDVWLVDESCEPIGEAPLRDNLLYAEAEANVDIPAGAIGVGLDTFENGSIDACFRVPDLGAGNLVNVYATNDGDGVPYLFAQLPEGATAEVLPEALQEREGRLRVSHMAVFPDGQDSSVEVWINGKRTPLQLQTDESSGYVTLPAGTYSFSVVPAGGGIGDAVFTADDFILGAGQSWSLFATGYVSPAVDIPGVEVRAFLEDDTGLAADEFRVNIIHAAALPLFNPVDVWLVTPDCSPIGEEPFIDGFVYGTVRNSVDVPGAFGVGLETLGNGTIDACFQVPDLGDGTVANVYATNDIQGSVRLNAQLPDGSNSVLMPE